MNVECELVVPGVTLKLLPPTVSFLVLLAALQSCGSTLLGSLKVRYLTTPAAELNPQYLLITDSTTVHLKTGTVLSFFICTIPPKMVLSTSWWRSAVGQGPAPAGNRHPPCWWRCRSP